MTSNPTSFQPSRRPLTARLLALGAGLALASLPLGCDDRDDVADAIQEANIALTTLAPGATPAASPSVTSQKYNEVVRRLTPVATQGGEGQQAAANLLIARAKMGLAGQAAAEAFELERASLFQIERVRTAAREYLSHAAQAGALAQYDPSAALQEIDQQITAREADLAAARKRKQEIDNRIAALRSQAQAQRDKAAGDRQVEAELRQEAARADSDTRTAELIALANEHRRAAEAFEVEAERLEAQAAMIAPESPEADLLIRQRENQRDQLGQTRSGIQQRIQANREYHAAAQAEQARAADVLAQEIQALLDARAELPERYRKAAAAYAEAAATAGRARTGAKDQAQLAMGEAQHALGDLQWGRAQGLAAVASVLRTVAESQPAPREASEYGRQAGAAADAEQEALQAAAAAYQAARDAYRAVSTRGVTADRLREVGDRLAESIRQTSGGAIDIEPDDRDEPEPEPEAPDESATPGAAAAAPEEALRRMSDAIRAGRQDEVARYFHSDNPAARQVLAAMVRLAEPAQRLDAACKARFGQSFADLAAQSGGAMDATLGGIDFMNPGALDPSRLQVRVQGDTATVSAPGAAEPIQMRRIAGEWKVDLTSVRELNDPEVAVQLQVMLPKMVPVFNELADEVEQGRHASLQAVAQAMMQKMMALMAPGPGGG